MSVIPDKAGEVKFAWSWSKRGAMISCKRQFLLMYYVAIQGRKKGAREFERKVVN